MTRLSFRIYRDSSESDDDEEEEERRGNKYKTDDASKIKKSGSNKDKKLKR